MGRELVLALLLSLGFAARAWAATDNPAATIAAAEDAALRGDYEKARAVAAPLKDRADLPREVKARFFLLQARIADAYESFTEEKAWLQKLKETAPETQLDRYRDPPALFRAWDELKGGAPAAASAGEPPAPPLGKPPVWTAYAPFGIGHFAADEPRLGAAFLGGDLLALYLALSGAFVQGSAEDKPVENGTRHATGAPAAGPLLVLGVYGHEVVHSLSLRGSAYAGEQLWAKRVLMFFPFGVGQARNGEPTRAAYFAGAQAVSLILAGASKDRAASAVGWTAWAFSYGYSVLDAWLRTPQAAPEKAARFRVEPWFPAPHAFGARLVLVDGFG